MKIVRFNICMASFPRILRRYELMPILMPNNSILNRGLSEEPVALLLDIINMVS